MTISSGSFSLSRYQMVGCESPFKLSQLNKKLKIYQSRPLLLQDAKELTFGWERPSTIEPEAMGEHSVWDMSDCRFDEGFMLRIRIEKRKVPNTLLQIVLQRKIQERQEQNDGKPLSRKYRKELLEEARQELFLQCLPNVSFTDVYWHEVRQEVFLFSTSKGIQVIFEELFKKTFCDHLNISLIKIAPPLLGISQEEWLRPTGSKILDRVGNTLPFQLLSTEA